MVCQKVHKQGKIEVMVNIQSSVPTSLLFVQICRHRCRKHFHLGGAKRNIQCDMAICAACININKVLRVKYWGALPPPVPTPMVGMDDLYIYHHLFFLVCVLFGTPLLHLLSFLNIFMLLYMSVK